MASCWTCSEFGSWRRKPNVARYVVILRVGNTGEIRLLCLRHARMHDEPTTLVIDIDDWKGADLRKHPERSGEATRPHSEKPATSPVPRRNAHNPRREG